MIVICGQDELKYLNNYIVMKYFNYEIWQISTMYWLKEIYHKSIERNVIKHKQKKKMDYDRLSCRMRY